MSGYTFAGRDHLGGDLREIGGFEAIEGFAGLLWLYIGFGVIDEAGFAIGKVLRPGEAYQECSGNGDSCIYKWSSRAQ
ncbi:MAG TPA: hypothetical protein VH640_12170 [Bryobacteraceae bacterium]